MLIRILLCVIICVEYSSTSSLAVGNRRRASPWKKSPLERTVFYNKIFKGPRCLAIYGPGASCTDYFDCKYPPQGENFYICGWNGYTPKICCFKSHYLDTPVRIPPKMDLYQEEGSPCNVTSSQRGTCELVINCKTYPTEGFINICGWARTMPVICCSETVQDKVIRFSKIRPSVTSDLDKISQCGVFRETLYDYLYILNGRSAQFSYRAYVLNETVDILSQMGYSMQVRRMELDSIDELYVEKDNKTFLYAKKLLKGKGPMGGHPAGTDHAQYMASFGAKISNESEKIVWTCDGVVINFEWIMSAAHCFVGVHLTPNIVRLGVLEHDEPIFDDNRDYHNAEDFEIAEIIFHPEFVEPQRYHDIILIRLSRPIPKMNHHINPLCLPWELQGTAISPGQQVILTGWGATQYSGNKTTILQEVGLMVFDTAICDASYSTLSDYDTKWPEGMDSDRILCAGSVDGGKDACGGDSGGPLVFIDGQGRFILAGIVSGGHGCGLKEFPGLYTPITGFDYLDWIRKVAF